MKADEYKEPPPQAPASDIDDDEPGVDAAGDDKPVEWRHGRVDGGQHGQRLDKVLVALAPEFSRSHLQRLLEAGHVRVDGVVAKASSQRVRAGQALELGLVPTDESRAFRPQPMTLAVLHPRRAALCMIAVKRSLSRPSPPCES